MSLKKNLVANYLGQGWTGLIGLAFVPLYIKHLGIESYGLIGIFTLLQAWLTLLDMGMTPTLNREMARFTAGTHTPQSIHDLLRSMEMIALGVAVLISLLVWAASGWLASDWLRAGKLSIDTVAQAIAIMGAVIALRLFEGIYRGTILGLQKQVFFNAVNSFFATLRAAGAVAILIWVSPTIQAYFVWQGMVSVVSVISLAAIAHRHLPKTPSPPKFSRQAVNEVWRFAGGMMATTLLAILLTQVDKILLSKLINLEAFGYYTLANTVATAIYLLIVPITQAFYPRFTELASQGDTQGLIQIYHRSAQLVTVVAAPIALMLIFFGENLLTLWTGSPTLAHDVAPLLALLAAGTLLNGLMHIPYMLQLAHGWSGLAARVNLIAVIVLVPAILWAVPRFGAVGAAWAWIFLNTGYVLIGIQIMHRRLLPRAQWQWYWKDVCIPFATAALIAAVLKLIQPMTMDFAMTIVWFAAVGASMVGAAILVARDLRITIFRGFSENTPEISELDENKIMSSTQPLVTVGIPTFNRPDGLRRSLDCISRQTYPNLEIIVSDNASPGDETRNVVEDCMARDARIRYVRQPSNLGATANFQYLLDAASGEYFLWVSDDDWRAPSYIEVLLHELQADEEAAIAFCDIAVLDEQGNRRSDFYASYAPYLKQLTSSGRLVRLTRFFLQHENYGKACLMYGLMPSRIIKSISLDSVFELYGFYGLDNLIIFILLGKGKLKLVEGVLYGCTAGNIKHYAYASVEPNVLKRRSQAIARQLRYLFSYLRLSDGVLKMLMVILFPVKLTSFYWHLLRKKFVFSPRGKF